MLNKDIDGFKYDENNKVCGVVSGNETARCKFVVCDPTYAKTKCKITGKIIRAICIMEHPMESTKMRIAVKLSYLKSNLEEIMIFIL